MRLAFLLVLAVTVAPFALPAPPALRINTKSIPPGTATVFYSTTFSASGGKAPYTWSLGSGLLPPGITLSPTGTLSGTTPSIGPFQFSVQVTDRWGATATLPLTLTITGPPFVRFLSGPLPTILPGVPYSVKLPIDSNTQYACAIAPGLPPGLSLAADCTLSGISPNYFTVSIQANP